jgi:hypothetical protein
VLCPLAHLFVIAVAQNITFAAVKTSSARSLRFILADISARR